MKAFLLAAGHGTRLRPLTDSLPKCLLPIRGTPLLEIWIKLCHKHGIDELLINTHSHASEVSRYLDEHKNGCSIKLVQESKLLGSAGTLRANRDWVADEKCFWIFYADVLTNANLGEMFAVHQSRKFAASLGVCRVPDPERCGVVTVGEDGVVEEFVEKPSRPKSNLAFAGLILATPELLDRIPATPAPDIAFDVLPRLAGRMMAHSISEYLLDIGTIDNYERAQKTWPGL